MATSPAPASRSDTADTRRRAVAVARELFAENGYAGTSIADIADRLGVSKAAVYYHFRAKVDLLYELITPMFEEMQALLSAPPGGRRALLEGVVDVLAAQRSIIGLVAGDPSVAHAMKAKVPMEHFGVLLDALVGARASKTQRLRARCAIGAIHAAVVGPMLEQRDPARGAAGLPPMTAYEKRVVVDAALAALGD